MASSQQHNSLTAGTDLRNAASADGHILPLVQERVSEWVAAHPWTMVGVAAGAGVAIGAATRLRAANELARVTAATASGIAVRLAVNSLTSWFARERSPG
jgi:hypothetical protein